MPVTGVYFVPCNPNSPTALGTLVEQLRAAYHHPTPAGRWGLEHKLLRDTPSCLPPSAYAPLPQLQPRSMQFLSLSNYQSHGFVYISDRPEPDPWDTASNTNGEHAIPTQKQIGQTSGGPPNPAAGAQHQEQTQVSSVPRTMITLDPQSFGSFLSVTLRACEPLWCHRHTVTVPSGIAFSVSDFHIRLGDVRQTQPTNRVRGTVVEIEYRGPSTSSGGDDTSTTNTTEETMEYQDILAPPPPPRSASSRKEPIPTDEDWETGAALIREFWSRIAVPGAREAILVPGIGTESRQAIGQGKARLTTDEAGEANDGIAGVDLARQYMEVFRFNR